MFYKIRRLDDGLFSMGGNAPHFAKNGKSWTIGGLKNHLRLVPTYERGFSCYEGCELVAYVEVTVPPDTTLADLIHPIASELVADKLKG